MATIKSATTAIIGSSGLIGAEIFNLWRKHTNCISLGRSFGCDRQLDLNEICHTDSFKGVQCLIHAAGIRDEDLVSSARECVWRANEGAKDLFETAAHAGVKEFIYLSTAHVYGALEGPINEQSPTTPQSKYGEMHLQTEHIMRDIAVKHGIKATIVRPNAVFGLPRHPEKFTRHHLVPFQIPETAILNGCIKVQNPGVIRNFVSTCHVAKACFELHQQTTRESVETINPIGRHTLSIGDYGKIVQRTLVSIVPGRKITLDLGESLASISEFEYQSIHRQPDEDQCIEDFVRDYLLYLLKQNQDATV